MNDPMAGRNRQINGVRQEEDRRAGRLFDDYLDFNKQERRCAEGYIEAFGGEAGAMAHVRLRIESMRSLRRPEEEARYRRVLRALEAIEREGDMAAVRSWIATLEDTRLVRAVLERRVRDATSARRYGEADFYARHLPLLDKLSGVGDGADPAFESRGGPRAPVGSADV